MCLCVWRRRGRRRGRGRKKRRRRRRSGDRLRQREGRMDFSLIRSHVSWCLLLLRGQAREAWRLKERGRREEKKMEEESGGGQEF